MIRVLFGLLVVISAKSSAYVGSVSAATGEAGRAAVEASESPFGNPASVPFLKGYYFSAGMGATRQTQMGTSQDLAVSLTENMKETIVPTSFSYLQNTYRPDVDSTEDVFSRQFKLSFGSFLRPGLAYGLGISHQNDKVLDQTYSQTNLQLGFLWAPKEQFGLAATFDNLIAPSDRIPEAYRLKQQMTFGGSYNYRKFVRFKGDIISGPNNSLEKPTLAAGMESYMNRWLILRWGLQRNNEVDANLYTAGMGFIGPKFGLHYAYQNSPQNESLSRHSVDLAVPIW